jgi:hypothetical protein
MTTLMDRLTADEVATFAREGFVHQRRVFTGAQLAALAAEVDRLSGWPADRHIQTGDRVRCTTAWLTSEPGKTFAPVRKLDEQSAPWGAACTEVLSVIAAQLLGEPSVLDHAMGIVKPPQIGQTFPWHQDGIYYGPSDGHMVLANVYLDDVTPENGSLRIVPRTHGALLPHSTETGKKALPVEQFPAWVEPQATAGDVVWFHIWAVHGSAPNTSASVRRAVRVGYRTAAWL